MVVQVDIEVKAGRFLESFGTKLYLGMYSPPVHAVLKPESDMLHLVVDDSSGDFGQNSIITCEDVVGIHLDGIFTLGASILQHNTTQHEVKLVLFKSDVSTAYQQLLIHPFFQIIQIMTVNGQW